MQLVITAAIISLFKFHNSLNEWNEFVIKSKIVFTVVIVLIMYCEDARKTFPLNFIMFFICTVSLGCMLSVTLMEYSNDTILLALGCISAICIFITLFAWQTKKDCTVHLSFAVGGLAMTFFLIIISIFLYNRILEIVYASAGVVATSLFLIVNTQMILSEKTRYQFQPDEYILGAITIYLNILFSFLFILRLFR